MCTYTICTGPQNVPQIKIDLGSLPDPVFFPFGPAIGVPHCHVQLKYNPPQAFNLHHSPPSTRMRRTTRTRSHISAALRGSSFDSDLTDLYEVEDSLKRSAMTRRVNNTDAREESDSELSNPDPYSAADRDKYNTYEEEYEGEYEEMDSEWGARTPSAYHGSDSEISDSKLEKKQPRQVGRDLIVSNTTSKVKEDRSALQSDTVRFFFPSACLLPTDLQMLHRTKAILRYQISL